jgi:hypothetical protein
VLHLFCRRRDTYERAELSCGTYEVVATKEYFARPAMPVIHVFLIDVGHAAVASGATAATCQCIEQVLDSLQGEWLRCRVGYTARLVQADVHLCYMWH